VACPIKINVKENQSIMESLEIQLVTLDTRHRTKAHRTKKTQKHRKLKGGATDAPQKKLGLVTHMFE
jgi:hypothetical protein